MLGFGRGSSVEVVINGMPNLLDADKILRIIREKREAVDALNELQARYDEQLRAAQLLAARLETANLKLREFGNPGQF